MLIAVMACCALTLSCYVLVSYAQSLGSERAIAADDDPLLHPLPPGIRVRAFIHTPRVVQPNHTGICKETVPGGDELEWYDVAPWRIGPSGITWKLNESTVPAGISASQARSAIDDAFSAWSFISPNPDFFFDGGKTTIKTAKLDGTNAILWKKLRAGILGETYVWYDTVTGLVVEADSVFNSAHPWVVSNASGDCSDFDAYDLQNIATHELGHWIGLEHVFAEDLTMFLFGAGGELKKRSLGVGDVLGACFIYGCDMP